jgi:hypothetical protein
MVLRADYRLFLSPDSKADKNGRRWRVLIARRVAALTTQ